jgi:hypothetical protein
MKMLKKGWSTMSDVKKTRYSIKEASEASGLSISTLYKLSAKRVLCIEKIGSRVLLPSPEFYEILRKHRVSGNRK